MPFCFSDTLKIADFGLATVFRHRGRERALGRACGSLPYIAPEVMSRSQFRAQPADIWSCGIVLTTMLTGGEVTDFISEGILHFQNCS